MDFSQIDEVTGNFPGWQYIPIILGVINLILSAGMFLWYNSRRKIKRFSYVNVMILGLGMFTLVLGIYFLTYYFRITDTSTLYLMLVHFIFSARMFVMSSAPVVAVCVLVMIISDIVLIRKEGFFPSNLFGITFSAVIIIAMVISYFAEYSGTLLIPNAIRNMWYVGYCYLAAQFISVVIIAIVLGRHRPSMDKDNVLILGCRIRDDGTLYPMIRGRVDKAMDFIKEQESETGKKAIYMPSGGKGTDEVCSEAEAMENYLIDQGIPEESIIAETKSTNTYENLKNCREIINDDSKKVVFSTSNYHVMRAGMIASDLDWNIEGIGSKTAMYYWPNALAREFVGLLARTWKLQLFIGLILMAVAAGLTYLIEIW